MLETVREPVIAPAEVGLNSIKTIVFSPGCKWSGTGGVEVRMNCDEFKVKRSIVRLDVPELATATDRVALVVFTGWFPKLSEVGFKLITGEALPANPQPLHITCNRIAPSIAKVVSLLGFILRYLSIFLDRVTGGAEASRSRNWWLWNSGGGYWRRSDGC